MLRTRTRGLVPITALLLVGSTVPALAQEAETPSPGPAASPAAESALTPSAETAAALVELVPSEIAGMPLTKSTFEAAQVLADVESDALLLEMADLALAHDTELDRFAVAGGGVVDGEAFVSVIGGHLPGVPAVELQEAFVSIVLGPTDLGLTELGTIAGHDLTIIRADADSGPADTAYLLPVGEVAWLVIADEGSLEAAIEALADGA
jgi:hypothetical protein